jgi:surface protein
MFDYAEAFNRDLSSWDVASATMNYMLFRATALDDCNKRRINDAWAASSPVQWGSTGYAASWAVLCEVFGFEDQVLPPSLSTGICEVHPATVEPAIS